MYHKSEIEIEVRYYETDQMGVVHHSNYIRYFECGRCHYLKEAGIPIEKIEEMGVEMPVVSVTANYKFPAKMGDILRVVSRIDKEPMARVEILTEIYNQDNKLLCDGSVVLGFTKKDSGRPTRVPHYFLEAFTKNINT